MDIWLLLIFFVNDTAPPEIYTLSLHDALPISVLRAAARPSKRTPIIVTASPTIIGVRLDRKSTRLNSSHVRISYAVFCLKKKKKDHYHSTTYCPKPPYTTHPLHVVLHEVVRPH